MSTMASILSTQSAGGSAESGGGSTNLNHHDHHLNSTHGHLNNITTNHTLYNNGATFHHQLNTIVDPNGWGDYYDRQAQSQQHQQSQEQQSQEQEQQQQQQQQQQQPQQSADAITRPWELDPPKESASSTTSSIPLKSSFEPFSKLPSFQSQFHFGDASLESGLIQPIPVAVSPSNGILNPLQGAIPTTTHPNFHSLASVNTRSYPIVPAPITPHPAQVHSTHPHHHQQYIDDRHIQLAYQPISTFPTQNVVTVIKNEPPHTPPVSTTTTLPFDHQLHQQHQQHLHHTLQQQSHQMIVDNNGVDSNNPYHSAHTTIPTPTQTPTPSTTTPMKVQKVMNSPSMKVDARKKERRKIRTSSLESSAESESAMDVDPSNNPGQVDAVSSTANFKSPMNSLGMGGDSNDGTNGDNKTKKKRKRCGECIGCQRKDNCGDCAPCRNDKSHQICKQRRCEKLTDKKLIYGADGQILRTESRRGRGKGRGGGATRGRKPSNITGGATKLKTSNSDIISPRQPLSQNNSAISPAPAATVIPHQSPNAPGGVANTNTLILAPLSSQHQQSLHQQTLVQSSQSLQQQHQQQLHHHQQHPTQHITAQIHTMKDQPQQPMAPMAFYPTWQTDPSQGWQNQFIQQIPQNTPSAAITSLNSLEFQPQGYTYHQPNGYVQTAAGIGFDPNYGRTYAAPVQRYDFQTQQISAAPSALNQVSLQSVGFTPPTVTYAGQVSTTPASPAVQQQLSASSASAGGSDLNKAMSGNDTPGYPRVNSVPPRSLNCNGYSGDFSGNQQPQNTTSNAQQAQQQQQPPQSPMHPPPPSSTASTPSSQQQVVQSPSRQQRHVSQSPNHIPQSPGMTQQYSVPQSPQQTQQLMMPQSGTTSSPSHVQMSNQDWNWNSQTNQPGGTTPTGGDLYNQADRVNLNTRIKSMIMRKNDPKDMVNTSPDPTGQMQTMPMAPSGGLVGQQPQSQTGHFLSYSHHLRQESTGSTTTAPPNPGGTPTHPSQQQQIGSAMSEPIGGGGDQIWKPQQTGSGSFKKPPSSSSTAVSGFQSPEHQQSSTNQKQNKFSSRNRNNVEKNLNDPGGGSIPGEPPLHPEIKTEKGSYSPMPNYTNLDAGYTPSGQFPLIKQEPGLMPSHHPQSHLHPPAPHHHHHQSNKMEGYERNYQNFIQYADFVQNEVQPPSSGENYPNYHQSSSYYGPGGYQQPSQQNNYQHNFAPSYQHSSSSYNSEQQPVPNPPPTSGRKSKSRNSQQQIQQQSTLMDLDHKTEPGNIVPLPMNYEKEIPAHAYPIPPRFPPQQGLMSDPSHFGHQAGGAYPFLGEGGPAAMKDVVGYSCCRQGGTRVPTTEHLKDGTCAGLQTKDEILDDDEELDENGEKKKKDNDESQSSSEPEPVKVKRETINPLFDTSDRLEKGNKAEVPECDCFSSDKNPPEPGTYYTHLGSAATLQDLRKEFEDRCHISGRQLRIEKILYTGKEGKTNQGCPVAKWVIRRADPEEKILVVVKKRIGHKCNAAFIVVCMVAWDGMPRADADNAYAKLIGKLNKYGLPTTRRCATNENRTCACQGLDPETSGASYSFGCSWSMYYNGCKYARSKTVRKFRLSVKNEETEIEDHMNVLATILAPIFKQLCPRSYDNQTKYEGEASDCRLGIKPGKPFSGVTACLDFCAHAHRDLHNMQDGCTVHVGLLKPCNRDGRIPEDEQFHVLPLYTMDTTDEFESSEGQLEKNRTGAVQILEKYPTEVRVRSTPLQPCRRHGKKRKEDETTTEGASNGSTPQTQQTPQPPQPQPPSTPTPTPNKKESSKSKSKSKQSQQNQQGQNQQQSAPPSTPSPRCQTPVTNNPSPASAGSAFTTPPVNAANPPGNPGMMSSNSSLMNMATMIDTFTDAQLQSNQISSTVLDSPYSYDYQTGSYIDNRNYYGNWPPPPQASPAHPPPGQTLNTQNINVNLEQNTSLPQQHHPPSGNLQGLPQMTGGQTAVLHTNANYSNFNHVPSNNLTQLHDVRMDVKSRLNEENPDSTTIVNHIGGKITPTPTPPAALTPALTPEEGFVKPKPPPDYQYTQYPNYHNQMYHPPPPTYSHHYDAYNNMNYNYGYHAHHQPYSHYGMYPQQTPPPTPPPPSPNWNMYPPSTSAHPHHPQSLSSQPPPSNYQPTALPPQQSTILPEQQPQLQQLQPQKMPPQQIQQPQAPPQQIQQQPPQQDLGANTAVVNKAEPIGEVTEVNENIEAFQDPQMGGVAIALNHGSVLIECAKHEMHATTSLKKPDRHHPTRMTLIFYQHRNLNRTRHGIDEWEEKMRVKKINTEADARAKEENDGVKVKKELLDEDEMDMSSGNGSKKNETESKKKKDSSKDSGDPGGTGGGGGKKKKTSSSSSSSSAAVSNRDNTEPKNEKVVLRAPTLTTTSWTTLFPMHPCTVTGPYQEGNSSPTSTTAPTPPE